jgi:hypothetical protein
MSAPLIYAVKWWQAIVMETESWSIINEVNSSFSSALETEMNSRIRDWSTQLEVLFPIDKTFSK